MRVKFGNHIDLCKRISHTDQSTLLNITTIYNQIYTVECGNSRTAENLFQSALLYGHIDVSDFQYSN